jgi:predicted esterase
VFECNPTGGSGGLVPGIYDITVANLPAVVVVGKGYDPQTPTYLGFFLHGDGGNYYRFKDPTNQVTKFITEQGWILVSPQSPNDGKRWWTEYWEEDHTQEMAAVLDEMFAQYNICRNQLFGSGVSGGSEFWANNFFPNKGAIYPAHVVLNCGGDVWIWSYQQLLKTLGQQPNIVAKSSFTFVYGTEDYLYSTILRAIDTYTGSGFRVIVDETPGMGHCNSWFGGGYPTVEEKIVSHWTQMGN